MGFPIPRDALDDRLAIVGTAGSGKTYLTLGAIEHLFAKKARVIAIDPLGVMWGLRLCVDGKTPSPFQPVIFGGAHGDLPISEHAGALIGQAIATSPESCIIDLSQLGTKAAERRFMLALLTALYRDTNKEPVHLIVDEADMFAPQSVDKEGEGPKLLGMMETIVRRGRVRGFIPWLITQRPAVLNKNVLSQADGLVAMKLTSSQDRDQLGDWVEGQADKAEWKAMRADLATLQRGEGIIWIPGRSILSRVQFPPKATFDSSRTPKRGEKVQAAELRPLDLGKLKDKLATVEAETKANDPKALKAEIARLTADLRKAGAAVPGAKVIVAPEAALKDREAAFAAGAREGREVGFQDGWLAGERAGFTRGLAAHHNEIKAALGAAAAVAYVPGTAPKPPKSAGTVALAPPQRVVTHATALVQRASAARPGGGAEHLTTPQRRVLASIGFWLSVGNASPSRAQVGGVAGYSPSSGGFNNLLGALNTAGLISLPRAGAVALADGAPYDALTAEEAKAKVYSVISHPQCKLVDAALEAADAISRDDLGAATGYSPSSGGFNNLIGSLNTLTIFEKPSPGMVRLSDWAREVLS